jgi:hypothetical protein
MCFSYIHWSLWYAGCELIILLVSSCDVQLWDVYACEWFIFCENATYDPLLWVECITCSNCAHMTISCLICAWVWCSFHLGSMTHLSSWMFSLHATLWRSLSFICLKGTHVPCLIVNHEIGIWEAYASKNIRSCHMCFKIPYLGC